MKAKNLLAIFITLLAISAFALAQPAPETTPQPVPNGPASTQQAEDPAVPAMKTGPRRDQFIQRHQLLLDRAKKGDIDVLFLGDSITQGWESKGKNVWSSRYAEKKAANFGIGGDKTQHVLWRIANGELDGVNPKVAVLLIGTNNAKNDA